MRNSRKLAGLAAALLIAAGLPALAQTDNTTGNNASRDRTGSTSDRNHGSSSTSSSSATTGDTMHGSMATKNASCQEVARQQQDLQRELRADDDRLASLVAQMNAATGDNRTSAMAAVINELVTQRRTLPQRIMSVEQATLRHIAMHAAQGGSMASAMNCPAMQGMDMGGTDTYRTGSSSSSGTTSQGTTTGTQGNDSYRGRNPGTESGTRNPDADRDSSSRVPSDSPRTR